MDESQVPSVFVVIPVFNRIDETLICLAGLRRQRYPAVNVIVVDGGSTDDTVSQLEQMADVTVITDIGDQWWTGATWYGIEYAMTHGADDDFVMLLNNDTTFGPEMLEVLVREARQSHGAVAPIALAADGSVINGGTWIDWTSYRISQATSPPAPTPSSWRVDALEGRGTLVPMWAIRAAGNVDRVRLPHYGADYEFSLRLSRHGCPLTMTDRTSIAIQGDRSGILAYSTPASLKRLWWELTNQASAVNIRMHFTLIDCAAPPKGRLKLKVLVAARWVEQLPRWEALRNLPGVRAIRARIRRPSANELGDGINPDLAHSPREDPHTG
jgi:N-acetylglucosaminyl-diphospho-decaprenol L-rhamnosyltransferase